MQSILMQLTYTVKNEQFHMRNIPQTEKKENTSSNQLISSPSLFQIWSYNLNNDL